MLEEVIRRRYNVALYIRLSKEDADRGYDESESITNQKILLENYLKNLGSDYHFVDYYIDPGYTGTNFNRPDFKRMINDINLGKVNMVITKDLSRLGRDYIETGEYIEKWFPENNVRYISITDGIDTFSNNNGNNDIAPFKSILNDMYSKDLSKKIKTALHTMQAQGKWVGGKTPLGYMKDPNDKNKLIICEEEAPIIRTIFEMAATGIGIGKLRDYLQENNIPTAHQIRYNKITYWNTRAIKRILTNYAYKGVTIQNKRSRISYKNRKLRPNPVEQWYIVEGTHKPIIDPAIFDNIQKMKIAQAYTRIEKKNFFLLDGLMICYECKHKISVKKGKGNRWDMICSYYRRFSKLKVCTSHGFNYYKLEEIILNYLKKMFRDIDNKKIELSMKNMENKFDYNIEQEKIKKEITIINQNIDKMYVDKLNNKISEQMYERLYTKMQNDIKVKEEKYIELEKLKCNCKEENDEGIEKIIKQFLSLEKPTAELMKVLINRIEIHQDKQIDIIFNFKKLNNIKDEYSLI